MFSIVIALWRKVNESHHKCQSWFYIHLSQRQKHFAVIYWVLRIVDAIQFFTSFVKYNFLSKLQAFNADHEF